MIVREAVAADIDTVLPMAAALATSFVVHPSAFRRVFAKCLEDAGSVVAVAESHAGLVGYVLGFDHYAFFANGRVASVEEIFVVPQSRGEGVGRALMRWFEAWASDRGDVQVTVCTRRAAPFYTTIGYEETAVSFRRLLPTAEPGGSR